MSDHSQIEWTDATWNPITGCTKVSPGCDHCYAERITNRFGGPGAFDQVVLHPERLDKPLHWRKPRRVFVNSMSDLFHDDVPDGFIARVWEVMAQAPQHTFQILTKRPGRMRSWLKRWHDTTGDADVGGDGLPPMPRGPEAVREVYSSPRARLFADMLDSMGNPPEGAAYPLYDWMQGPRWFPQVLPNVCVGTSVEDQHWAEVRIPILCDTPAAVRFLSCEPLLGPICLDPWHTPHDDGRAVCGGPPARLLHWVIVGGESGPHARPMHPDWARSLRDQCTTAGVPFLFKQWGGHTPKAGGRELDGRTWDEFPREVQPA